MQCYKLNVLCNEVLANGSTGSALQHSGLHLADKLMRFICDFPQGMLMKTTSVQSFNKASKRFFILKEASSIKDPYESQNTRETEKINSL